MGILIDFLASAIFLGMMLITGVYALGMIVRFFLCVLPQKRDCLRENCPLRFRCERAIMTEKEWAKYKKEVIDEAKKMLEEYRKGEKIDVGGVSKKRTKNGNGNNDKTQGRS